MNEIIVNGEKVSPQKFEEYKKRIDIVLHQIAPGIYITLTQTDVMSHDAFSNIKFPGMLILPKENEIKPEDSKKEISLPKKKGRMIIEEG